MASYSITPKTSEFRRSGPWKIAVLLGGDSAEREISLASGAHVVETLLARGHQVCEIDPKFVDLTRFDWAGIDIAFLALHGKYGEDGHVQSILDLLGVPYTGSDAEASRIGISKSATKERLIQQGIPTANYVLIHESDSTERILAHARSIGFPIVVKPDTQGSSLGVSIVHNAEELPSAVSRCFELDSFGILETAIIGSEWTVGILDESELPAIQISTGRPFFTYEAKYQDDDTGYKFDYDVPNDVVRRIEQIAHHACRALGTRGLARVDIMLDKLQRPFVLEINTIPGLTDHSLVPKAAARIGWSFAELCERAIVSSLRYAESHSRPLKVSDPAA
ncbi:MAG: D-alanine--D-alanine ligase [Planctomycetaceae bacterium]|nr:D-alanine--D-alanine ligase [Planctomycetaceae bacterium]